MAISKSGKTWIVSGIIQNSEGGKVSSLKVNAYDKNWIGDEYLGMVTTDSAGKFQLNFKRSKSLWNLFDRYPDLYFKVQDGEREVLSTRGNVIRNAKPNKDNLILRVRIPDEKVETPPVNETIDLGSGSEALNYKISAKTELMHNYKMVELISQENKFSAVQTNDGNSLLFSIGSDGKFYLIQGKVGSKTGWIKTELGGDLVGGGATVKNFEVFQNETSGNIDIAVVMVDNSQKEHLFISQTNSQTEFNISWVEIPVDTELNAPGLNIADIYISSSNDGKNYTLVDTVDTNGFISRFWINSIGSPKWNSHPLPANFKASGALVISKMGRKVKENVDGVYTLGSMDAELELIYTPLYNYFDPTVAPNPTNFNLGNTNLGLNDVGLDLCQAASKTANVTDIYLAGGGSLYTLSAENQRGSSPEPTLILENPLFQGIREIHASNNGETVVIWGLNNADQIFYTSCAVSEIGTSSSWTTPIPIQTGVSQISHYQDMLHKSITFFANVGEGKIIKGIQDNDSSLWRFEQIELPHLGEKTPLTEAKSCSTTVQVLDQNNQPIAGAMISVQAMARTNVFINNRFYSLGTNPIEVEADAKGGLYIIEWIDGIQGTNFTFNVGTQENSSVTVKPLELALDKVMALNTVDALNNAVVQNKNGTNSPLIPATVSAKDKEALAASIGSLKMAYTDLKSGSSPAISLGGGSSDIFNYIETLAGDLLKALEDEFKAIIQIIKDEATAIWHFVVTIGEKVYGFILDSIEKIAATLKTVWNMIVTEVEKLWDYLKFLFDWDDIVRTKNVMKQCLKIYVQDIANDVQKARELIDDKINSAEDTIRTWAGLSDSSRPPLGHFDAPFNSPSGKEDHSDSTNNPAGQMLIHHFMGNIGSANLSYAPNPPHHPTWSGLSDLSDFFNSESAIFDNLKSQVSDLLKTFQTSGGSQPNISDILKKIAGDIALAAFEFFKMAIDKILDFLTLLIEEILNFLDTPIYIPILSEILELFGYELPSILDIVCIIGAVPATLIYKLAVGRVPFPAGTNTDSDKIIAATSSLDLKASFPSLSDRGDQVVLSDDSKAAIYITGHLVGGIVTMIEAPLKVLDDEADGAAKFATSTSLTFLSVISKISNTMGDLFEMESPIKNPDILLYQTIVGKMDTIQSLGFQVAPKAITKISGITDAGAIESLGKEISVVSDGVSAVFALAQLVPPCYHIYEISEDGEHSTENTLGILESTQQITENLNTMVEFFAEIDEEEISKNILVGIGVLLTEVTGAIKISQGIVEAKAVGKPSEDKPSEDKPAAVSA